MLIFLIGGNARTRDMESQDAGKTLTQNDEKNLIKKRITGNLRS